MQFVFERLWEVILLSLVLALILLAWDLKKSLYKYTSGGVSIEGILSAFFIIEISFVKCACFF